MLLKRSQNQTLGTASNDPAGRYTARMRVQRLSTAQHRGILVTWRAHPIRWATLGGFAWLAFVGGCTALAIHYAPSLLAGLF